jgi:hemerythrin-like domain-containing protein
MATTRSPRKSTKPNARVATKTTKQASARKPLRKRPGTDAITILKQDHREVEQVFKRFEKAGSRAHRAKRQIVDSITEMLSRHAAIEELVFYPAVRREVSGSAPDVLEALEEHHIVKFLLRELEDVDPRDERFDAKVTVMIENVRHHVKEEENELFPEVRKAITRQRLLQLGDELRAAKPKAPTRPHPGAPDEPPGNVLLSGAVAVVDRARTAGKRAIDRVLDDIPA